MVRMVGGALLVRYPRPWTLVEVLTAFVPVHRLLHGALLVVLKPKRIIRKRTDASCRNFHLRVFLGLSNPQGQRQTSTISIPHDNFGERKAKFNLEMSRTTQMQLYKCIHVP
jgi:hypothetical protein